jgi:hypothetical protein
LTRRGYKVTFEEGVCTISKGNEIVGSANHEGKLFRLQCRNESARLTGNLTKQNYVTLWHQRMGRSGVHRSLSAKQTAAKGYRILNPKSNKVWVSRSVRIIEDVKRTPPSDNSPEPKSKQRTMKLM